MSAGEFNISAATAADMAALRLPRSALLPDSSGDDLLGAGAAGCFDTPEFPPDALPGNVDSDASNGAIGFEGTERAFYFRRVLERVS